jgi:predicted helicase
MLARDNLALITVRQVAEGIFDHALVTRDIVESRITLSNKGIGYVFPLYQYPDPVKNGELFDNGAGRHINLSEEFISEMEKRLRLKFVYDGEGDLKKSFGPEDIFNYIYAVFHSPTYRKRYAEFLKIDFPRVPLTSNANLFRKLVALGGELVALHLLESPQVEKFITTFPEPGDNLVDKGYPKYVEKENSVYINKTQRFKGVPRQVWEFHVGGYQVCEKWLKDRRGRNLSYEDLSHYQKIVAALSETIRIMTEIDKDIPSWPMQ